MYISFAMLSSTEVEEGGGCIMGYFHSPAMLVSATQPLNFDELIRIFNDRVEQFTQRSSGYMLSNIIRLSMIYVTFLPVGGGSSYIPTPKSIVKKRAVVNVKLHGTDCFCWAILSALYPVRHNANRLYVRRQSIGVMTNGIQCRQNGPTETVRTVQLDVYDLSLIHI